METIDGAVVERSASLLLRYWVVPLKRPPFIG